MKFAPALLLPLLALTSCKDVLGGGTKVEVLLTASVEGPAYGTAPSGAPTLSCTVHFDALGRGTAKERAEWTKMVIRYYMGGDFDVPVDSSVTSTAGMRTVFGAASIGAGDTQRASWDIAAGLPFSLEAEARYRTGGVERSARARAACGPQPPPASAPAPTITYARLTGMASPLQPGDSVVILWGAMAPAGLWATAVEVEGTETLFSESLTPGGERRVAVRITGEAGLDVPVRARVYAVDVLGRVAWSPLLETPPVVDVTPPRIWSARVDGPGGFLHGHGLRGGFAAGDSIPLLIQAGDNHRIEWLVLEVEGMRDSLPVGATAMQGVVNVRVPQAWVGREGFSLHLRDLAGNRSAAVSAASGAMSFYAPSAVQSRVTVSHPGWIREVLLDEAGGEVWTAASQSAELRAYAAADLSPRGTVVLPGAPESMDLTVTGDTLVATVGASLVLVDLRRGRAITLLPVDSLASAGDVRISATGEAVVAGRLKGGASGLVGVSLRDGSQRVLQRGVPGQWSSELVRSGDRRLMVVGRGCLYDPVSNVLGTCRSVNFDRRLLSGDLTGARWVGRGSVFDRALNMEMEIPRREQADGVWFTGSGDEVLFGTERGPVRVRVSDGRYLTRYDTPWPTTGGLVVDSAGRTVFGWGPELIRIGLP